MRFERVRADFTDPQGPMTWRVLPYLPPIAIFFFAAFGLEGTPAWTTAVMSLVAFNLLGVLANRQRRALPVDVVLKPGVLEIRGAGTRNQRIRTKDIIGATTGRTKDGVLLTFQHVKRDQPITLRVANDAEADAIRQALGIGHGGFGQLGWRSQPSDSHKSAVAARIAAVVIGIVALCLGIFGGTSGEIFAGMLGFFGGIAMLIGLLGLAAAPNEPSIVMAPEGLRLRTVRGWFALPYESVLDVTDHKRGVVFTVPPPYHTVGVESSGPVYKGLSAHDRDVLLAQINAASQRARGLGPQKNDASARVDALRRNGETPRNWLMRLDMQGRLLGTAGPGYRAANMLDTEDLWAILEDPEAEPELRTAAARVLRHSTQPDTRVRIDAAVAAVRDDSTNKRLRIATNDDVDAASQELALLEAEETRSRIMEGPFATSPQGPPMPPPTRWH